jgi:hypothetical protein
MATKADLERKLAQYEGFDAETIALQGVVNLLAPFAPKYHNDRVTKERKVIMARILAQAAERFDLPVYSDA